MPLLERSGSVHAARLKQQGRRLPVLIFEMLTSTLRSRVSGLLVAFTHRTHSHRAIGVMSLQTPLIVGGAEARAEASSGGTLGSGHCLDTLMSTVAA